MSVESKRINLEELQKHYDDLYAETPVRDDDRGYQWLAGKLYEKMPELTSLLDVACGGGYFLREVGRRAKGTISLTGIDISSVALKLAQQEISQASLVLASAEEMPFKDESFDAISCLGSMEHFLDIAKAIAEMKRVIRPKGIFFILLPNMFWYKDILSVLCTGNRKTRNQIHERFASLGEWVNLFKDLGLEVVSVDKYNGIARNPWKQRLKDCLIPLRVSYHFLFTCRSCK